MNLNKTQIRNIVKVCCIVGGLGMISYIFNLANVDYYGWSVGFTGVMLVVVGTII